MFTHLISDLIGCAKFTPPHDFEHHCTAPCPCSPISGAFDTRVAATRFGGHGANAGGEDADDESVALVAVKEILPSGKLT